jgi:hypothetical protein
VLGATALSAQPCQELNLRSGESGPGPAATAAPGPHIGNPGRFGTIGHLRFAKAAGKARSRANPPDQVATMERQRRTVGMRPASYAIDRPYWCRWRSRQVR